MITFNGINFRDLELAELFDNATRGMKQEELSNVDNLIKIVNDSVSLEEPNFRYVSANLLLHKIKREFKETVGELSLYQYIQMMVKEKQYTNKLLEEYSESEINDIEKFIDEKYNYDYDYAGMNLLYKRYLTRSKQNKVMETPELMYIVIAMMLAIPEKRCDRINKIKYFYSFTHSRKISLATPILLNLRKINGSLSSCFILSADDSLLSINHTINEIGLISQQGGGVGVNVGRIRATGSMIGQVPEASSGIMSWIKIIDTIGTAVNQKGCVAKNSYVKRLESVDVVTDNGTYNISIGVDKHSILSMFNSLNNRYEDNIEKALIKKIPERFAHMYDFFKEYISIKKSEVDFKSYAISKFNSVDVYKKIINKFKKNIVIPEGYSYPIINGKIISEKHAINKDGDIISLSTLKSLNLTLNKNNYLCFSINKQPYAVHRVIYHTFNNDADYSMTIDHIDSNKLNNSLLNLQLLSSKENIEKYHDSEDLSFLNKIKIRVIKNLDTNSELNGKRSLDCVIKEVKYNYEDTLINRIRKDDFVLAYDIERNVPKPQRVLQSYSLSVDVKDQIKIIYEDGSYIITSNWHPLGILEDNKIAYKRSDEIKVGELSVNYKGNPIKIVGIENNPNISSDYHDLHVKNTNNYFASTDNKNGFNLTHNSRNGAVTVAVPVWHYDIEQFIHCQTENGDLRSKAFNIFPQVIIPDLFMQKVENNEDWAIFCPYEVKKEFGIDINGVNKEEFEELYLKILDNKNVRKKIINAKDLLKEIMKTQTETGMPYTFFKDTVNETNPNIHDGVIENANLCVAPETYITTKNGLKEIKDFDGQEIELWNGSEWSLSKVFKTSENQKLIKIYFNNGGFVECTEYHRFPVLENHSFSMLVFKEKFDDSEIIWKQAKDIEVDDRIFPYKDFFSGKTHKFVQVTKVEDNNRYDSTYCFTEPKRNMGMFNNVCLGNCSESYSNFKPSKINDKPQLTNGLNISQDITSGVAHTCNLVSPNLALIDNDEDLEQTISLSVNILDNTIELTETPIPESKLHNEYYRIIGVGGLGLADWLAKRKLTYRNSTKQVNELFEKIAYYGIKESVRLAKERGIYPLFEGSEWSKGIVFGKSKEWFKNNETNIDKEKWYSLLDELQRFGIRNGGIFALPPNTSSSLLVGATASILPPYSKMFIDKNSKGAITTIPPFLNKDTMWYYQENKNIPQEHVINTISTIQQWVDQGISGELLLNIKDGIITEASQFYDLIMLAWKKKMKTIYYIRQVKEEIGSNESSCVSCAN